MRMPQNCRSPAGSGSGGGGSKCSSGSSGGVWTRHCSGSTSSGSTRGVSGAGGGSGSSSGGVAAGGTSWPAVVAGAGPSTGFSTRSSASAARHGVGSAPSSSQCATMSANCASSSERSWSLIGSAGNSLDEGEGLVHDTRGVVVEGGHVVGVLEHDLGHVAAGDAREQQRPVGPGQDVVDGGADEQDRLGDLRQVADHEALQPGQRVQRLQRRTRVGELGDT